MGESQILLVGDEANIIQLGRLYLELEDLEVLAVSDGRAGVQTIEITQPDLDLLGVMRPELDRFKVCRCMREQKNQILIRILTVREEAFEKILGLELDTNDYMTKPFNPRELFPRVDSYLAT
jgi:two-component system, OmpR family, alkaline phosphatase synthesis response regulator PhoP